MLKKIVVLVFILSNLTTAETVPLKDLAKKHNRLFGTYADPNAWKNSADYRKLLQEQYSLITVGVFFIALRPDENTFNFTEMDQFLDLAKNKQMKVRITPVVWGNPAGAPEPKWVLEHENNPERLKQILKNHIQTLFKHLSEKYSDQIIAYDLVNEPLENLGTVLRKSVWSKIHPENPELYIHDVFRWAHEADPNAKLFLNECFIERHEGKFQAFLSLVKSLLNSHIPISGVGIQMHQFSPLLAHIPLELSGKGMMLAAPATKIKNRISVFQELGLDVHLSEMDIPLKDGFFPEQQLAAQKKLYQEYVEACLAFESCKAIVTWGIGDKDSWIPSFFSGYGRALLFDEFYRPKPAYFGVVDAFK